MDADSALSLAAVAFALFCALAIVVALTPSADYEEDFHDE